jgi:hypothetical protein
MSAVIKRFLPTCDCMGQSSMGDYVFYTDHLAALAAASGYDEEKERGFFEVKYKVGPSSVRYDTNTRQYVTDWPSRETLNLAWRANILLEGWLACARTRATEPAITPAPSVFDLLRAEKSLKVNAFLHERQNELLANILAKGSTGKDKNQ